MPRAFLIDTDTASDDAVAIIMALRAPDVRVVAITTVAGNVDVQQSTRNAIYTGRWATPHDEEMIAAMRQVCDNREEVARRGERAAERASRFTWRETARKLVEVLVRHRFLPEHHDGRGQ